MLRRAAGDGVSFPTMLRRFRISAASISRWVALSLWLSAPAVLVAQPAPEDLEQRLADAVGAQRLPLLVELAAAYRESDPERAVTLGSEALEWLAQAPDKELEITVRNSLSYAHHRLQKDRQAISHAARARRLALETGDRQGLAFALRNLARAYRSLDDYKSALEHALEAARQSTAAGDPAGKAEALSDVGITYRRLGDDARALEHYLRAHRIWEWIQDHEGRAKTLNNIGIVYRSLGDYDKALELYAQALKIQQQAGDHAAVGRLYNNMGVAYRFLGELERAIEHYQRAAEIKQQLGDDRGLGRTLNNIGLAYKMLGEPQSAVGYYRRALAIKEKTGDRKGITQSLQDLAEHHQQRGEHTTAIALLRRALALAKEIDSRTAIRDVQAKAAESYTALGRFEEALAAFREHERLKSELRDERRDEAVAEMQARFEAERMGRELGALQQQQVIDSLELRRQEITRRALAALSVALLLVLLLVISRYRLRGERRLREQERARQQDRERYVAELESSHREIETKNAEMERFTYTASHDLKTPLITIRGFLGMLEQDLRTDNRQRITADLARIKAATSTMARLLDELLELSRIGRVVGEPEAVPLGELAREAVELVDAQIGERRVEIETAADLPTLVGDRLRLLEVLQNLVENAVKFMGEQPRPRIEIGRRQDGGGEVCYVRDNGIGIDPRYHEKIFGLFDRLDPEVPGTGVGLALVRRIVEVHGGRIWVESEGAGRGSTFCFSLAPAMPRREAVGDPGRF